MRSLWMTCLIALLAVACQDVAPTAPDEVAGPLFKPKCDSPPCNGGGEDPPPPPPPSNVEPHVLFSSGMEGNEGGGGCKRGDLGASMYRMDLSGNYERVFPDELETQAFTLEPSFSPDGQRFVMFRDVYTVAKGRCATENLQIATAGVDGSDLQVIADFERGTSYTTIVGEPEWSPVSIGGSERIAWRQWNDGVNSIVTASTDGSGATPLVTGNSTEQLWGFAWSRAGDQMLVYFEQESQLSALRLYSLTCGATCSAGAGIDVGNLSPIPPDAWFQFQMDWAHSSDRVLVSACPAGDCDIYLIDLTDPQSPVVEQITAKPSVFDELEPRWSPDDSKVLFVTGIDGNGWLVELDLSVAALPWDGDLSAPGLRLVAATPIFGGADWRSF